MTHVSRSPSTILMGVIPLLEDWVRKDIYDVGGRPGLEFPGHEQALRFERGESRGSRLGRPPCVYGPKVAGEELLGLVEGL